MIIFTILSFIQSQLIIFVTADAGNNISIALPITHAILNGTKSKDDIKIVLYQWEQVRYDTFDIFISCCIYTHC
jgi:hypothetical protein